MTDLIFVHGMFQDPKSWERWVGRFKAKGYTCSAPAWPFHYICNEPGWEEVADLTLDFLARNGAGPGG